MQHNGHTVKFKITKTKIRIRYQHKNQINGTTKFNQMDSDGYNFNNGHVRYPDYSRHRPLLHLKCMILYQFLI